MWFAQPYRIEYFFDITLQLNNRLLLNTTGIIHLVNKINITSSLVFIHRINKILYNILNIFRISPHPFFTLNLDDARPNILFVVSQECPHFQMIKSHAGFSIGHCLRCCGKHPLLESCIVQSSKLNPSQHGHTRKILIAFYSEILHCVASEAEIWFLIITNVI